MAKAKKATQSNENILSMNQDSYDELKKELENRITNIRKDIADEIKAAMELGDLSENHAYTVAMDKKEMNENRILELEDILAIAKIVTSNASDNVVNIGEPVELFNVDTKEKRVVVLVGTEESKTANSLEGKISIDSPVGKAIHNAMFGDTVEVQLGRGPVKYKIGKPAKKAA
jgi:transcription elongation factor GreA